MYGKKRIVITKDNTIVLAGDKNWNPIGKFYVENNRLVGKLRNVDSDDTNLNDTNSVSFNFTCFTELKKFAKAQYVNELI